VVQTLRNAILQDRLAHAFLFTGARGVGKTTIARIMAKALNCLAATGRHRRALPEVRGVHWRSPTGRDPDVQEIDGASNNGVDDVRRLQETLPYRPLRDRYKVVIIDECHMVSTNGWNALLKTLEEPPPHVKFIFATTEVHKVIPTILSRVQRYDFRLLPTQQIRDRVAYILAQEGMASTTTR
jgi:DNA polymerase-3 subunit gamma/tau